MSDQTVHILLVEDDEAHAELVRRAFEADSGRVCLNVAGSLRDARDSIAKSRPDLVIVDLFLPDGKGIELLPDNEECRRFPFLVITSYDDVEWAVKSVKAGALDYMVKSADILANLPRIAERILSEWNQIILKKRAEEAMHEDNEKYRTLVEKANDAILILQEERTVYRNQTYENLIGYRVLETGEQSFLDLVLPEDRHRVRQFYYKRLNGELVPEQYELGLQTRDDRRLTMEVKPSVVTYQGKPATLVVMRDITEKRKLENQLRQSQKMEAIGTLAGGIVHDFNNILSAIIGYTDMALLDVVAGSPMQHKLDQVLKESNRAKDLVQQILAFSRQSEQERKPVHLSIIVREALKLLRASLPSTIEILQSIQGNSGMVLADLTQIHQVLMNLCTNSAHAMGEKGGVLEVNVIDVDFALDDVTSYPDLNPGSYLKLTVSDTGHGIEPVIMDRIFDPYFTTKGPGEGTGMGLAVVHGIIKSHGGAIKVYSEPGKGSTFNVFFPRINGDVIAKAKTTTAIPTGSERILLVDDEEALVEMGKQMLGRLGYKVVAKTDSFEALETFRAKSDTFDLVITDLTMPNMTGTELANKLMEIRADIPIILCSGFNETITRDKAKEIGIREYLFKPLIAREMAEAIRRALDKKIDD